MKLRPDKGIQMRVIVETQRFVGWGYRASWFCYIHKYILNPLEIQHSDAGELPAE